MKRIIFLIIILLVVVFFKTSVYIVDETNQIIVTRFGKWIKTVKEPGLYFRVPFIDIVTYFDKRILDYDSLPKEVITKDKKNIVIDNYAKWKIVDPLKFYKSVGNEHAAQYRLDDIVYSVLRERLGKHNFNEIISKKRATIMEEVTEIANKTAMKKYGIHIIDVRIKRADLPKENENHIYQRMRADREKQAKQYRAEGHEIATRIRAEADKMDTIIMSEAMKKSLELKGSGDAKALKIYADAYNKNPDFYKFYRTLKAYEQMFTSKDIIILSPESEILNYLKHAN